MASLGETVLEGCTDAQVVSSSHTFLPSWQAWGLHYVPAALLNAGLHSVAWLGMQMWVSTKNGPRHMSSRALSPQKEGGILLIPESQQG